MRRRLLSLAVVFAALLSCTPRQDVEVLSIRDADPRALGARVDVGDLGVSFQPPAGWRQQEGRQLAATRVGSFAQTPAAVFFRDDGTGFCLVSRITGTAGADQGDVLQPYCQALASALQKNGTVSYKNLRINGMPGILLRAAGEKNVLFNFIVAGETGVVEVDFGFPASEFTDTLTPRMKASVASLRGRG